MLLEAHPIYSLNKKRSDWLSLPNSRNIDYAAMFTYAGENLLHTFCEVSSDILNSEIIKFIEDTRQNRNKAIHGASNILSDPSTILNNILKAYTYFFGRDQWFIDVKNWDQSNPLFGYYDWGFESIQSYKYLDFIEAAIGIKKLNKFLNFDVSARRYFCPMGMHSVNSKNEDFRSKWAFLHPNHPTSKSIYCINCSCDNEIERIDCNIGDCKGNVIDVSGTCLTCGEMQ